MTLLEQKVEIVLNNRTIKHYEGLGYEIPRYKDSKGRMSVKNGTNIVVDVHDLTKGSNVLVKVQCDYCRKIYEMIYCDYQSKVVNGIISKVACWDCSKLKLEESTLKQFGVKNNFQRNDVKSKRTKAMIEKYGVVHPNQNSKIISKVIEKKKLPIHEVYKRFNNQGFMPLFKPEDYKHARQALPYRCPKHLSNIFYTSANNVERLQGCPQCAVERTSGQNHYNWNGGVSNLNQYVRDRLTDWKTDSMRKHDYKCVITGERFDTIHHLHSFNLIRDEALNNLNLDIRPEVNQYTDEELESITNEIIELHHKYGLGVPLKNNIHDLFHNLYGRGDNTPEQFEEFKIRYRVGEFDKLLKAS